MKHVAASNRYKQMTYRNCGNSGLKLPLISLGLWHNFGGKIISKESKKVFFCGCNNKASQPMFDGSHK